MIGTQSKSLGQTIADGLSKLNVGDTIIVARSLGYPHQQSYTAAVEKITTKQIVVDGRRYWKSGEEIGTGVHRIFPNDESLIEWAVLMKKARSAMHSIHEMQPDALKDLLGVFEKHGHLTQEIVDSKQPATLMEVMDRSGLINS